MRRILLFVLFFSSCAQKQWSNEITEIIRRDAENKRHEIMILEEIGNAETNEDRRAFMFFFQEYMRVPRLKIREEWKSHPEYIEGGLNIKY